jgi:hypothetical protein
MLIPTEHMLVATCEIGMHLSGKKCILGDVGAPRVVVQRQHEEPCDADYDTEEGEVRREFEQARVAAQET